MVNFPLRIDRAATIRRPRKGASQGLMQFCTMAQALLGYFCGNDATCVISARSRRGKKSAHAISPTVAFGQAIEASIYAATPGK
jgi:hypothetical protein